MRLQKSYLVLFYIFILTSFLFFLSLGEDFFWDNVLFAGKMGTHLYNNGLFELRIPIEFDPGHPPFLAFVNALGWKLLGRHMWVSHLVMAPFIFGFLYQLYRFVNHYIHRKSYLIAAVLLILVDPTVSAHLLLVNPQIIQLFFFFMAVNGILYHKPWLQVIGLAFLGIVTFRGMMLCAGIFLFEMFLLYFLRKETLQNIFSKRRIFIYALGAIPATSYVLWRLINVGWLQTHPDSPWSELWQFADFKVFLRNILVLGNRFLDFGRIGIFIFLIICWFTKCNALKKVELKELLLLGTLSVIVIIVVSLFAQNAMGHRYYIAAYIVFILSAAYILSHEFSMKLKMAIYGMLLALLLAGNFWIYPQDIAQGWDSSLAHIPYFKLRKEAIVYMDDNGIEIEQTASFFPNSNIIDYIDLSNDLRKFPAFDGTSDYVLYSNVFNLTDNNFNELSENYDTIKVFKKNRIEIILYKKTK